MGLRFTCGLILGFGVQVGGVGILGITSVCTRYTKCGCHLRRPGNPVGLSHAVGELERHTGAGDTVYS